jgi:hypothetical protein
MNTRRVIGHFHGEENKTYLLARLFQYVRPIGPRGSLALSIFAAPGSVEISVLYHPVVELAVAHALA